MVSAAFRWAFLAIVAVAATPAVQAQQLPRIEFTVPSIVEEGDEGPTRVLVRYALTAPSATEVAFTWSVVPRIAEGEAPDIVAVAPTRVRIPPSETGGEFYVEVIGDRIIESNEYMGPRVTDVVGALAWEEVFFNVWDDDERLPQPWIVRDDSIGVPIDWLPPPPPAPQYNVTPSFNDVSPPTTAVTLTIVSPPAHGSAAVILAGSIKYVPVRGYYGRDRFRVRQCRTGAGAECRESWVNIGVGASGVLLNGMQHGGRQRETLRLPRMTAPEYSATALYGDERSVHVISPDFTPGTPWDSDEGIAWIVRELPALPGTATVDHEIVARLTPGLIQHYHFPERLDMYVGLDRNGDGRPSADEVVCNAQNYETLSCGLSLTQGATAVRYWVMAHNRDQYYASRTFGIFDIPLTDGGGVLSVSGPGSQAETGNADLDIAWNDATLATNEFRIGMLMVRPQPDAPLLLLGVNYSGQPGASTIALQAGVPRTLKVFAGETHPRTWFDVPAGATSLSVVADGDDALDYYLVRRSEALDAADAAIAAAPGSDQAAAIADGPGGDATMTVQGAALAPGRWYVVTANTGTTTAQVTFTVAIDALAPVVRTGSYFNAGRPGSGIFLHRAGDQWTGLWYTYRNELGNQPRHGTWYYLQAPAPGTDGIWHSPIYRGTWNGSTRTLNVVGNATVTATGPDAFLFSYTLEGRGGSQPMAALGRGCPTVDGSVVDASGQWFDPDRTGTGYSVQTWPDGYEYFAAYVYDARGEPLFLAAERAGGGGAEADAVLQRLTGACPTCVQTGNPLRENVGVLSRRLAAGRLQQIAVDALLDGVYDWTTNDDVQPLGETQGCAP